MCSTNGTTCYATGNRHYHSFDLRYFEFQGTCEYILTQSCDSMEYAVIVNNSAQNSNVSYIYSVRVVVPGENLDILLGKGGGGTVTINSIPQINNGDEVILTSGGVEVVRVGGHPHVLLNELGVRVSWDGLYRVEVTVSTSWRGRLCGLCGNYNGDRDDDFTTPNTTIVDDPNDFGVSWLLVSNISTVCLDYPLSPGPCDVNLLTEGQIKCAVLHEHQFRICNDFVDPSTFIESCIFDYCYSDESIKEELYFQSLAVYASACAHVGVVLPGWIDSTS